MFGRYRLSRRKQFVEEYFGTDSGESDWNPRYNIAPTQPVPVIRQHPTAPTRKLSLLRWGLVPSWARDTSVGAGMINARSEAAAVKPAFREALQSRRCLIPADGFYEWQRNGKTKQPHCLEVGDGELFAFAGLWDRWMNPQREVIESYTILTTTANSLLSDIHDRMPVILSSADYKVWLDPAFKNIASVEMLKPFEPALMRRYPVSTRVNNVQNDDADCANRVDHPGTSPAQSQLLMFPF
jgi:putative SOS response-associated peptidase YedK